MKNNFLSQQMVQSDSHITPWWAELILQFMLELGMVQTRWHDHKGRLFAAGYGVGNQQMMLSVPIQK